MDKAMTTGYKLSQKLLQFSINCFASMPMLQATQNLDTNDESDPSNNTRAIDQLIYMH